MNGRRVITGLQIFLDVSMALLAVLFAYQLRFRFRLPRAIPGGEPPDPAHYLVAAIVAAGVVVGVFALLGIYRQRRGMLFVDELLSAIWGLAIASLVLGALMGIYHETDPNSYQLIFSYSRVTFVYWIGIVTVLVSVARYVLHRWLARRRARGVGVERAVVVGWGEGADLLVQRIKMFPDYGYRLVGVLADSPKDSKFAGLQLLGQLNDLERIVTNYSVNMVFIAISELHDTLELVERCRRSGVETRILPGIFQLMASNISSDQIDGIPLIYYRHGLDIAGFQTFLKRAIDVLAALVGGILISPLLLLIALMVRLTSKGPILIHQERTGMNGRTFYTHKFRSMRVDAEAESGPVFASANDPRCTWIGRWIRRFSLDELPQLWNILCGEMSLVGPRPERPSFVAKFSSQMPRYLDRHRVRPGLTGWAQANDLRGQTSVDERLNYDLYYIESWSVWFDIKILILTLVRVWTQRSAY